MSKVIIDISHIDTCLSCYLQDHHNRAGELLLGVPVDGTTTMGDVLQGIRDEYNQSNGIEDQSGEFIVGQDEAFEVAHIELHQGVNMDEAFDDGLESPPNEDEESEDYDAQAVSDWENAETCYAWFVITATVEDSDA